MKRQDIQSEVIDLLTQWAGLPSEKGRLSQRLAQDLGLNGDDANEFFEDLRTRFGTDFTQLHERWDEHFYPEGLSPWLVLGFFLVALVGGALAYAVGLSGYWGLVVVIPLLAAYLWARQRWPRDNRLPITVDDVLAAVERGSWGR